MQAASVSNPDAARLADVLAEALCTWEQHRGDDGVFIMALPLQGVDPLQQLLWTHSGALECVAFCVGSNSIV